MCAEECVRADENRGGPRERDDADGVSRRAKDATTTAAAGTCVFEPSRGGAEVESRRSGYGTRGGARVVVGVRRVAGSNSVGGGLGLDAAELAVDGEETLEVGEVAPANRAVGGSNPVGRVVRGSRAVEDALGGDAEDAASVARRARGEKAREGRGRGVGSGRTGALGEASAPRDASAATTASASPPRALCSWSRVRSAEPRRESARTTRGPVPRSASATSGGGSEAEADDRTREPSETSAPRSTSSTGVSPPLGDIPPWLICARDPRARGGVTCGRASGVVTRTARVERPDERSAMHTAPQKGDSSSDENHGCRPTNFVGVGPAGQISYRSL